MSSRPGSDVASTHDLLESAEALLMRRNLPAARRFFDRAEAAGGDPDRCSAGRWLAAMLGGDFETAWQQSDAIHGRNPDSPHRLWMGEDVRGKRVIVRSLRGFGDAVQMLAFAPLLRSLASHVVWEVPPRMLPLAPFFDGMDEVITWGEDAPKAPPAWDVQVEMSELPYLFRMQLEELPLATGYLRLPGAEVRRVAQAMGPRVCPRVGVLWACGDWNPDRNLPIPHLERVLDAEGIEFWSLQGPGQTGVASKLPLKDALTLCGEGLVPLAATLANLDLVITPDTLQAHLAGAIGVPVWILLQHAADWRWMVDRPDTPWYPSARLFRQPVQDDWAGVFEQVASSLRRVLPVASA